MPNLSPWLWLLPALLLFWAAGAYNRLVRLRSRASAAFAALDEQLVRQIVWVQGCLPEPMRGGGYTSPADLQDGVTAAWMRLHAASEQFAAALAKARAHVTDSAIMAGLALSHEAMRRALSTALTDAVRADAEPSTEKLQARWLRLLQQAQPLRAAFNDAAQAYNRGISQFPALMLARLLGFKPLGALEQAGRTTSRL
jgi:LemA protein